MQHLLPVSAGGALQKIQGYAKAGRVDFTSHALLRMSQRNVRRADVVSALASAQSADAQTNGTYKCVGPDLDGDDLTVIVAIDGADVVVTVF